VPQDNEISKYYFKAKDGLRHSTIFTFRLEPQAIRIKEAGKEVVQENCERCHRDLLAMIEMTEHEGEDEENSERYCWDCHREVPHGSVSSLSSSPHAIVPLLPDVMPKWIDKYIYSK